jgi:hypothetical protein
MIIRRIEGEQSRMEAGGEVSGGVGQLTAKDAEDAKKCGKMS